ncbi:MAG: hypothetical protein AAF456_16340 [Planctomycetota bacterium]
MNIQALFVSLAFALSIAPCASGICQDPEAANDRGWQVSHIPDDVFWTINFNVDRLVKQSQDLPGTSEYRDFLEQKFNLALADVEQFQVVYGGTVDEVRGDDDFLHTMLTFKTAREIDLEYVSELYPVYRYEDATHNETAYFQNRNVPDSWSALPVSDTTVLFAQTQRLHHLIDSTGGISEPRTAVEQLTFDSAIAITVSHTQPAVDLANWMMLDQLAGCIELIQDGSILIAFESDDALIGNFNVATADDAAAVVKSLEESREIGATALEETLDRIDQTLGYIEQEGEMPPDELIFQMKTCHFFKELLEQLIIQSDGTVVTVTLSREGGIPEALEFLGQLLVQG